VGILCDGLRARSKFDMQTDQSELSIAQEPRGRSAHNALIYLLDDDPVFSRTLCAQLTQAGMPTTVFTTLSTMIDAIAATPTVPDAFLIDFHLGPRNDNGLAICRSLIARYGRPILIISGDTAVEKIVACLDAGSSHYISKPCDARDVVARVRATLRANARPQGHHTSRASNGGDGQPTFLHFSQLTLNVRTHELSWKSKSKLTCVLSPNESQIVGLLICAPDNVVYRRDAYFALYGQEMQPHSRTIDVRVSRIRQHLRSIGARLDVRTVWGKGYCLVAL